MTQSKAFVLSLAHYMSNSGLRAFRVRNERTVLYTGDYGKFGFEKLEVFFKNHISDLKIQESKK